MTATSFERSFNGSSTRRTDDVDADGDIDRALVARGAALVSSGVRRAHLHEVQTSDGVGVHVIRQPDVPAVAVAQPRPPESRHHPTLRAAVHRRIGAEFQILVD